MLDWSFDSEHDFSLLQASSDQGCKWAHAELAWYFGNSTRLSEQNDVKYVKLLETSAAAGVGLGWNWLGQCYQNGSHGVEADLRYARFCFRQSIERFWISGSETLAAMCYEGVGGPVDLRSCLRYGALQTGKWLWTVLKEGSIEHQNEMCYAAGLELYWSMYKNTYWSRQSGDMKVLGLSCLNYYCENVQMQRKSIFMFLMHWNRVVAVPELGEMIAKMVWKGREECLVKSLK
jgi:hypothetical protein